MYQSTFALNLSVITVHQRAPCLSDYPSELTCRKKSEIPGSVLSETTCCPVSVTEFVRSTILPPRDMVCPGELGSLEAVAQIKMIQPF